MAPAQAADARRFDFGDISVLRALSAARTPPKQPLLQHDFRVFNDSGDTIEVLRVGVSCGCLGATLQRGGKSVSLPAVLERGDEITISVSVDPAQLRPGPFSKSVFLYTRRSGTESLFASLLLSGNLLPTATFAVETAGNPRQPLAGIWDLGRVELGTATAKAPVLVVMPDAQLTTGASNPPPLVSTVTGVRLEPLPGAGHPKEFRYRLAVSGNAPLGPMVGLVSFAPPAGDTSARAAAWRTAALSIVGEIAGRISAEPTVVAFGIPANRAQSPGTRNVLLTARNIADFAGMRVASDTPLVTARLLPPAPSRSGGATRTLVLGLTPKAVAQVTKPSANIGTGGIFEARVTVRLQSGQQLQLPVRAFTVPGVPPVLVPKRGGGTRKP